jgi:hypothetical protein
MLKSIYRNVFYALFLLFFGYLMGTSINCTSIAATWDNILFVGASGNYTFLLDKNSGIIYEYYLPSGICSGKKQLIKLGDDLSNLDTGEKLGQ